LYEAFKLLGAVLGFTPYNFNPASIFMGDTGSMLLGFLCATLIIMMGEERTKWLLAATVVFALPILAYPSVAAAFMLYRASVLRKVAELRLQGA